MSEQPVIVLLTHDADLGRFASEALAGTAEVRLAASAANWDLRRTIAFPSVTVVDLRTLGRDAAATLRGAAPDRVVALASTPDEFDIAESGRACAILGLPCDPRSLRSAVTGALANLQLAEELNGLRSEARPIPTPAPDRPCMSGRLFAAALRSVDQPDSLCGRLLDCLALPADAAHAALFLRDAATCRFTLRVRHGALPAAVPPIFESTAPLPAALARRPTLLSRAGLVHILDPDDRQGAARLLELLRAEVIVPLHSGADLAGWIALGSKACGSPFSTLDYSQLADAGRAVSALLDLADARKAQKPPLSHDEFWRHLSAALSHEVRNPLVALKTFTQLLPERFDDPEFREQFGRLAQEEIGRIADVVDTVEQFAHPEPLTRIRTDVRRLVEETIERTLDTSRRKNLRLSVRMEKDLPAVEVDPRAMAHALEQVLRVMDEETARLPAPEIRIAVTSQTAADGSRRVTVVAADNAADAAADGRESLLEPFGVPRIRGSGLGLPAARRNIERMGGSLRIETTRSGPAFAIELPAAPETTR